MKKNDKIILVVIIALAIALYFGNLKAVFPGSSSGISQWTLCSKVSTGISCSVSQGQFASQDGKVDGLKWQMASCWWGSDICPSDVKTCSSGTYPWCNNFITTPNKCQFVGTVGGHDGCTGAMLTPISVTNHLGTVSGDACVFDVPIVPVFPGCPDRIDITGSVLFYQETSNPCGNSICDSGETSTSCPGDCHAQNCTNIPVKPCTNAIWQDYPTCSWDDSSCICTPSCTGKTCGDDGCGGSCGTCTSTQTCTNNNCVISACPADAKQCPDGSYVGRTGPNCEFAPCPILTCPSQGYYSTIQTGMDCTAKTIGSLTCYSCQAKAEFPYLAIFVIAGIIIVAFILIKRR